MKINFKVIILCLVIVYSVAFVGSIFTSGNTGSQWYLENKPSITPPNFIFPIVWNILFFMIALSLYFVWIKSDKKQKKKVALVFGANLFLNVLWSFLFFTLQKPLFAFFELLLLLATIVLMIYVTWKINRKASYLLVPYFLWVCFAGVLNWLWI